jgi:hypothetical protein
MQLKYKACLVGAVIRTATIWIQRCEDLDAICKRLSVD